MTLGRVNLNGSVMTVRIDIVMILFLMLLAMKIVKNTNHFVDLMDLMGARKTIYVKMLLKLIVIRQLTEIKIFVLGTQIILPVCRMNYAKTKSLLMVIIRIEYVMIGKPF